MRIFAVNVWSRKRPVTSLFLILSVCDDSVSLIDFYFILEQRLEDEKIKFRADIKKIVKKYSARNAEIHFLYAHQKKIRDILSFKESDLRRLLVKRVRLLKCYEAFEKRKDNLVVQEQRVLFQLDELDDSVIFHFIDDYTSTAQETFIESISKMNSEKLKKFIEKFDFFMLVKSSSFWKSV